MHHFALKVKPKMNLFAAEAGDMPALRGVLQNQACETRASSMDSGLAEDLRILYMHRPYTLTYM